MTLSLVSRFLDLTTVDVLSLSLAMRLYEKLFKPQYFSYKYVKYLNSVVSAEAERLRKMLGIGDLF